LESLPPVSRSWVLNLDSGSERLPPLSTLRLTNSKPARSDMSDMSDIVLSGSLGLWSLDNGGLARKDGKLGVRKKCRQLALLCISKLLPPRVKQTRCNIRFHPSNELVCLEASTPRALSIRGRVRHGITIQVGDHCMSSASLDVYAAYIHIHPRISQASSSYLAHHFFNLKSYALKTFNCHPRSSWFRLQL